MILTAATAVGFGLMRLCLPRRWGGLSPHSLREWTSATAGVGTLAWTLAFVPLRLMRPRRPLDRLMCQPGMAACSAAAVVIIVSIAARFLTWVNARIVSPQRPRLFGNFLNNFGYVYALPIGPAVAATWFALILSGRWRPERGWIDRLGFAIGVFWIVFVFFQWDFGRWTGSLVYLLTRWQGRN